MNGLRIFVTEDFHDFMTDSKLSEKDILKSAHELANGLFDADLSGNIYKKRTAPTGRSKSGFGRALIAFRFDERIFFMAGWEKKNVPKSGREISEPALRVFKSLARELLNISDMQLSKDLSLGLIIEVKQHD
ncbi:type II toxin-antitoxin system RelE/ParE family toxin [Rahnella sp. PAMC25617]|uniref:type II toxin-antitoxin system RelE/ParE family toxin n=1 Tax=Rahnella sp. PAMC25617 TaxID=3399684 RepID=UPI003D36014A